MKNKISFISNLLDSKKIDTSQKERILLLTKKELDSIGNSNEFITSKIIKLEKKMKAIQSSSTNSISDEEIYLKIDNYLIKNNKEFNNDESNDFQDIINQTIEADQAMVQQHIDAEEAMIDAAMEKQDAEEEMMQQHIDAAIDQREVEEEMMQQHIDAEDTMVQAAIEQQWDYNSSLDEMANQKEKFFKLYNKEINKINSKSEVINKNVLNHKPKKITVFLNNFGENTDLKWSSHIWDTTAKYSSITEFIKGLNYDKKTYLFNDLFRYNIDLYNLIKYFLFDPKQVIIDGVPEYGWPNLNEVKFGWQTPNNLLVDWCKVNYDNQLNTPNIKFPMEFPLPKNLMPINKINGKFITTFEDIVNIFKNEIQFRDDYLYDEIKKKTSTMNDFKVDLNDNLKGIQFYTYTRGVILAVGRIFVMFKKYELFKNIKIDSFSEQGCFIIKLTQVDSFPIKKIQKENLKNFIGGDLNFIIGNVFSLCDYSIISKFKEPNGNEINGELVLLSENTEGIREKTKLKSLLTEPIFIPIDSDAEGFAHQFKFYL